MEGLTPNQILELEFNYIRETAHQAIEDRHRFLNFYIGLATTAGTIALGIGGVSQDANPVALSLGFSLVAFLIAVVGWIFLAMMIRLRQAWHESLTSMNRVKDFYTSNLDQNLGDAFAWDIKTLPKPHRTWNIHFFATLLVNFIASLALALSFILVTHWFIGMAAAIFLGILIWFASMCLLTFVYWYSLKANF